MDSIFNSYLEKIELSIRKLLPTENSAEWQESSFGSQPESLQFSHFSPLLNPTQELVALGGKRWRPLLLVLTASAASNNNPDNVELAYKITPLVEYVHTASLIHDDIEDSSESRRGKPAAYISYGIDVATNAAAWLFFQAGVAIDQLDCPDQLKLKLYQLYSLKTRCVHLGQAMDIAWHRNKNFLPTVDQYFTMVKNKTGTLSSLAAQTGALVAGADSDTISQVGIAAAEIGAGFQIIDDVINLTTGNPGKKRGDDIVEGKKSLPVLKFAEIASEQELNSLFNCFNLAAAEGINSPSVENAITLLKNSGAIKTAAIEGIQLIEKSCSAFQNIFGKDNSYCSLITKMFMEMIPPAVKKEAAL